MQYFLTYNQEKFMYIVWNNQQVVCRVKDDRTEGSRLKVVEFLQEEHKRVNHPLEIYTIPSASVDLEAIIKAVEGIRVKR